MALAVLLARWGDPLALIVDHGLRADSAAEAALTRRRLAEIGVDARVLPAQIAPGPAAAERARAARYALLLDACRRAGLTDLFLAHHRADQAETVHMRAEKDSGADGLAGMAAIAYRHEARLLRPLLSIPKLRLRATLRQAGLAWAEDPTNADTRTRRGALRAEMSGDETDAALALARAHGAERPERERRAAQELAAVHLYPAGFALVPGPLEAAAMSALVWTISGRAYPPARSMLAAGLAPRTLHGVVIRPAGRLGPGMVIAREPAQVAPPGPARPGQRWDGRFRLGDTVPAGLELGALGAEAAAFRRDTALPATVLRTLPAFRRDGRLVAVPHLAFPDDATCLKAALWFDPVRPLAGAAFVPSTVNHCEGQGM